MQNRLIIIIIILIGLCWGRPLLHAESVVERMADGAVCAASVQLEQ